MSKPDISILDLIAAHLSEQDICYEIYRSYRPSFIRFANCSFPYHYGTIFQEETYIKVEQLYLMDAECFDLTDPQSLTKLVEYVKTGH